MRNHADQDMPEEHRRELSEDEHREYSKGYAEGPDLDEPGGVEDCRGYAALRAEMGKGPRPGSLSCLNGGRAHRYVAGRCGDCGLTSPRSKGDKSEVEYKSRLAEEAEARKAADTRHDEDLLVELDDLLQGFRVWPGRWDARGELAERLLDEDMLPEDLDVLGRDAHEGAPNGNEGAALLVWRLKTAPRWRSILDDLRAFLGARERRAARSKASDATPGHYRRSWEDQQATMAGRAGMSPEAWNLDRRARMARSRIENDQQTPAQVADELGVSAQELDELLGPLEDPEK